VHAQQLAEQPPAAQDLDPRFKPIDDGPADAAA